MEEKILFADDGRVKGVVARITYIYIYISYIYVKK